MVVAGTSGLKGGRIALGRREYVQVEQRREETLGALEVLERGRVGVAGGVLFYAPFARSAALRPLLRPRCFAHRSLLLGFSRFLAVWGFHKGSMDGYKPRRTPHGGFFLELGRLARMPGGYFWNELLRTP